MRSSSIFPPSPLFFGHDYIRTVSKVDFPFLFQLNLHSVRTAPDLIAPVLVSVYSVLSTRERKVTG